MPLELRPFDYNVMLYSTTAWQQKYSVTLYSTTPWQQITLLGVMLFIMYIKIKKKNLEVRLHHWQWKFQIPYLFAQKISGFLWSRGVTPSNKNHLTWTKFEQEYYLVKYLYMHFKFYVFIPLKARKLKISLHMETCFWNHNKFSRLRF